MSDENLSLKKFLNSFPDLTRKDQDFAPDLPRRHPVKPTAGQPPASQPDPKTKFPTEKELARITAQLQRNAGNFGKPNSKLPSFTGAESLPSLQLGKRSLPIVEGQNVKLSDWARLRGNQRDFWRTPENSRRIENMELKVLSVRKTFWGNVEATFQILDPQNFDVHRIEINGGAAFCNERLTADVTLSDGRTVFTLTVPPAVLEKLIKKADSAGS